MLPKIFQFGLSWMNNPNSLQHLNSIWNDISPMINGGDWTCKKETDSYIDSKADIIFYQQFLKPGVFVTIYNPKYTKDIAQVVDVDFNKGKVLLKLIPRINYREIQAFKIKSQTALNKILGPKVKIPQNLFEPTFFTSEQTKVKLKISWAKNGYVDAIEWDCDKYVGRFLYKRFYISEIRITETAIPNKVFQLFKANVSLFEKDNKEFIQKMNEIEKRSNEFSNCNIDSSDQEFDSDENDFLNSKFLSLVKNYDEQIKKLRKTVDLDGKKEDCQIIENGDQNMKEIEILNKLKPSFPIESISSNSSQISSEKVESNQPLSMPINLNDLNRNDSMKLMSQPVKLNDIQNVDSNQVTNWSQSAKMNQTVNDLNLNQTAKLNQPLNLIQFFEPNNFPHSNIQPIKMNQMNDSESFMLANSFNQFYSNAQNKNSWPVQNGMNQSHQPFKHVPMQNLSQKISENSIKPSTGLRPEVQKTKPKSNSFEIKNQINPQNNLLSNSKISPSQTQPQQKNSPSNSKISPSQTQPQQKNSPSNSKISPSQTQPQQKYSKIKMPKINLKSSSQSQSINSISLNPSLIDQYQKVTSQPPPNINNPLTTSQAISKPTKFAPFKSKKTVSFSSDDEDDDDLDSTEKVKTPIKMPKINLRNDNKTKLYDKDKIGSENKINRIIKAPKINLIQNDSQKKNEEKFIGNFEKIKSKNKLDKIDFYGKFIDANFQETDDDLINQYELFLSDDVNKNNSRIDEFSYNKFNSFNKVRGMAAHTYLEQNESD